MELNIPFEGAYAKVPRSIQMRQEWSTRICAARANRSSSEYSNLIPYQVIFWRSEVSETVPRALNISYRVPLSEIFIPVRDNYLYLPLITYKLQPSTVTGPPTLAGLVDWRQQGLLGI